jgi:hypothetical protein
VVKEGRDETAIVPEFILRCPSLDLLLDVSQLSEQRGFVDASVSDLYSLGCRAHKGQQRLSAKMACMKYSLRPEWLFCGAPTLGKTAAALPAPIRPNKRRCRQGFSIDA